MAKPSRQLLEIPISSLTVGLNVREDATPDKELIDSVKASGILQPPTVTPNGEGGYEIVFGHRRANAAAAAGLTAIDAIVIDRELAEEQRLLDQITENDRRSSLTELERVGGYQNLALFNVSPAQIAKRLGVKRDRVDTVLAVASNEKAAHAIAEYGIRLDQAAVIVEFADDPKAVKELETVAANNNGTFDHVVQRLRSDRVLKAHIAELERTLASEVFTVFPKVNGSWAGVSTEEFPNAVRIRALARPASPTVGLTRTDIVAQPHSAGRIVTEHQSRPDGTYGQWATIEYWCTDPEAAGLVPLANATRELTPEEQEIAAARAAEREAIATKTTALAEAGIIRHSFIVELLARPALPTDAINLIAWAIVHEGISDYSDNGYSARAITLEWLGITHDDDRHFEKPVTNYLNDRPKQALHFALAAALADLDINVAHLNFNYIRDSSLAPIRVYLEQLRAWGYGLADIEKEILALASAEPEIDADAVDEAESSDDDAEGEDD